MSRERSVVSLEVYEPTGAVGVTERHADRLADLSGKTICELSDFMWEDNRTFPPIRELLQKRFPDTKIIPYTEFPNIYSAAADVLTEAVRNSGCDAVIVGNAA